MSRIGGSIKRNFIAGILVTVPFAITIYALYIVCNWAIAMLSLIPAGFLASQFSQLPSPLFKILSFAVGLSATLLLLLLAGALARNYIGGKIVSFSEWALSKIPFAGALYQSVKQSFAAIFGDGIKGLKRVVAFEYPRRGVYSIGFVTGVYEDAPEAGAKLLGVFLPTAFNPTGGFYLLIPEDEVWELDMSVEEAFRIIVSGGLASGKGENLGFRPGNNQKI
ncbi:MAG: DUF502 domain-containing protein [Deltaproteobacteria bacterium]